MATMISINPATTKAVGDVHISSQADIETALSSARNAQAQWKSLGVRGRINILRPLLDIFRSHAEKLALLITQEMGKTITESRAEIVSGCSYLEWFFHNAERALEDTVTQQSDQEIHRVSYEPLGTAAVILPWNFPFDIFLWGVMTNLLAGNTVVAKHSELCPLTGQFLDTLIHSLHLPLGVFTEVYGAGDTGSHLVHQHVDLIWFTGSTATGRTLYELGGQKMIKVLLELGGSNPTLVFEDADVDSIVMNVAKKRLLNCGQSCSGLKRLLVHASLFPSMVDAMRKNFESQVIGDPEDVATTIGPLASDEQAELLSEQVNDAVSKGATVIIGGGFVSGRSRAFYTPTILTNVTADMRVWREEVFGPVLPIVSFNGEEEAVRLAEDSVYGLGAQIFSKDIQRALRVATQLKVGNIEINGVNRRIPCNPFGGCKASGVGREHGVYGFREVSEMKLISMPAA